MSHQWFRLWNDFSTDPKWRLIAEKSGQPLAVVIAIAVYLMSDASQNEESRGVTKSNAEVTAIVTGVTKSNVEAVTDAMQGLVLDGNKFINWDKRQPKREREEIQGSTAKTNAQRQAEFKARKRAENEVTKVTPSNAQDTDKDTDKISKNNTPFNPPNEKPELKLEIESPKPVARKRAGDENYYTADFNNFWEVYPSNGRAKGSKHGAAKAYAKALKITTQQEIMQGIQQYETLIRNTGQLNADAATWLNQRRWGDSVSITPIIKPAAPIQQRTSAWEHNVRSGFDAVQYYRSRAEMEREPEVAFG